MIKDQKITDFLVKTCRSVINYSIMLTIITIYGLRYGSYQSYVNSGIDDNVKPTSERLATLRDLLSMMRLSSFGS